MTISSEEQPTICNACGRPIGTGTLADAVPRPTDPTMPTPIWRRFATRYRCPLCADVKP